MKDPGVTEYPVEDARHALYIGCVWGLAMRHGVPLRPNVDPAGNYTAVLSLSLGESITISVVVPPPPPDWHLDEWQERIDLELP